MYLHKILTNVLQKLLHIKIIFNNKEVSLSNPIVSINNRVYVSIRDLSETLGYNVEWQDSNHSININLVEKDDNENLIIFKQNQKNGIHG